MISFLTEEGPNNLVSALLKNGFGENKSTIRYSKERLPEYKKQLSSIKVKDVDKKIILVKKSNLMIQKK